MDWGTRSVSFKMSRKHPREEDEAFKNIVAGCAQEEEKAEVCDGVHAVVLRSCLFARSRRNEERAIERHVRKVLEELDQHIKEAVDYGSYRAFGRVDSGLTATRQDKVLDAALAIAKRKYQDCDVARRGGTLEVDWSEPAPRVTVDVTAADE